MYPNPFSVFRDLFSRRRTLNRESLFTDKCSDIKQIPYEQYKQAVGPGYRLGLPEQPPKPPRPGDSLPKAYINTTQATLVKTINTYENEINALDKDIGKLSEERRQAQIAVDGMRAALEHMNGAEDRHETKVDQLNETALVEALETL